MSWAELKASWSAQWRAFADRATASLARAIDLDPAATAHRVVAFVTALGTSRASLDRIAAKLPNPPRTDADRAAIARYQDLERRWHDLAAGLYADATPAARTPGAPPAVGVAPALVVGGLALTAVGVAWAIAAYEYAVNLQQQTELAELELVARVDASREGRALAPSTLPPAPMAPSVLPPVGPSGSAIWLFGGLAVAAGALALPFLIGRR